MYDANQFINVKWRCGILASHITTKGQWALQPFVTFTKRFTDGDIGCPTLPTTLHPIDFNRIVCPKIILSIIASLNTVQ